MKRRNLSIMILLAVAFVIYGCSKGQTSDNAVADYFWPLEESVAFVYDSDMEDMEHIIVIYKTEEMEDGRIKIDAKETIKAFGMHSEMTATYSMDLDKNIVSRVDKDGKESMVLRGPLVKGMKWKVQAHVGTGTVTADQKAAVIHETQLQERTATCTVGYATQEVFLGESRDCIEVTCRVSFEGEHEEVNVFCKNLGYVGKKVETNGNYEWLEKLVARRQAQ